MTSFDHALETVLDLPREEQDALYDILHKRRIEARREEIAANAREAIAEDNAGLLHSETASELIQRLRSLMESANATD
jgi:hypothetical protein